MTRNKNWRKMRSAASVKQRTFSFFMKQELPESRRAVRTVLAARSTIDLDYRRVGTIRAIRGNIRPSK